MVTLCDERGNMLARGCLQPDGEDRAFALSGVTEGTGNLLGYYFGRGGRAVTIETGAFRLRGVLATRWCQGSRRWTVEIVSGVRAPRLQLELPEASPALSSGNEIVLRRTTLPRLPLSAGPGTAARTYWPYPPSHGPRQSCQGIPARTVVAAEGANHHRVASRTYSNVPATS